jgi:endoglucanase
LHSKTLYIIDCILYIHNKEIANKRKLLMDKIHINQLGYRPNDPKKAVIPQDDSAFSIIRISDEAVMYNGTASEPVTDTASKDTVRIADFSAFTTEGEYALCTAGKRSYPFLICGNPYKELRIALLEMFNYQKCGVDLECGLWSHSACHTALATVYGSTEKKDVSGGWHDAGDYGRYIVPAAKSVVDLLLAFELSPNKDNGLLDIVWFEIEWMLKMQDEASGGVFHKVSCKKFNPLDEMPDDEHEPLFLSPISATATADFAAVMALASRFYPAQKDKLLKAAKHAWDWCSANPDVEGFTNPPDISTGDYGDHDSNDERFWAACELFAATKEETYHDYIKTSELYTGLGWGNMGAYGLIAYLLHTGNSADDSLTEKMKNCLLDTCRKIMEKYQNDPYGVSLGEIYRWGSNMIVANNAMMLLLGSRFIPDSREYTEAALEHFHYLLGRNSLSQSYITGFGPTAPKNPHHRPSVAKGSAVPGMVVGGPCMSSRDSALSEYREGYPPAKRYIDHKDSYASNEITIYWNSPVYFIMAALGL